MTRQTRPPAAAAPPGPPTPPAAPTPVNPREVQGSPEWWNDRFQDYRAFLAKRADVIRKFCRKGGAVDAARLLACAELEWRKNPTRVLDSSWQSMVTSLVTAAQLDLEPTGPLADGYLEPRMSKEEKCEVWTFRPMYKGLVKLAIRSHLIKGVRAHIAYANDFLQIDLGSKPEVLHRVCLDADRGPIVGAYAVATLVDGEAEPEWVSKADLDRIRAKSMGSSGPWFDWFDQMARKSAIRRLLKQLPAGEDYARADALENAMDGDDQRTLRNLIEVTEEEIGGTRQLGTGTADPLVEVISRPAAPPQTKGAEALTSKIAAAQAQRAAAKAAATPAGPPVEVMATPKVDPLTLALSKVQADLDQQNQDDNAPPACSECGASWRNDWKPGCFACEPPVDE